MQQYTIGSRTAGWHPSLRHHSSHRHQCVWPGPSQVWRRLAAHAQQQQAPQPDHAVKQEERKGLAQPSSRPPSILTTLSDAESEPVPAQDAITQPAWQQQQQERPQSPQQPPQAMPPDNGGLAAAGAQRSIAGQASHAGSPAGAAAAKSSEPSGSGYWQELLSSPEPESLGGRARSASDAAVLRRKGHLKEQDRFIDFLLQMHQTHTSEEVMQKMERWIDEHRCSPRHSRLSRAVPTVGAFFTPLRLVEAFREYDEHFALSRRRYVPPNFAELRHVLNIAQVHASAQSLRLITFDADGVLYCDGQHMESDNKMINHIISLMRRNVHVAIATAAGYPKQADRFEQRLQGLMDAFRRLQLSPRITDRFHVVGGECNYLLRVSRETRRLEFVPDAAWKSPYMMSWREEDIRTLLAGAERLLLDTAARLRLPIKHIVRKERAVGIVPGAPTIYEVLEELAITVQQQLVDQPLPFCAFNGGADVFVDVGNKSLGLEALMGHLGFSPKESLHVGDRFSTTGNDFATRDCCSILWVANPEETDFFVEMLLHDLARLRSQPYLE